MSQLFSIPINLFSISVQLTCINSKYWVISHSVSSTLNHLSRRLIHISNLHFTSDHILHSFFVLNRTNIFCFSFYYVLLSFFWRLPIWKWNHFLTQYNTVTKWRLKKKCFCLLKSHKFLFLEKRKKKWSKLVLFTLKAAVLISISYSRVNSFISQIT